MKQLNRLVLLLLFTLYCSYSFSQSSQNYKAIMVGSDRPISNHCNDSCVVEFKDYTVITKNHKEACGEYIVVVNKKDGRRMNIDVNDEYDAQYFSGMHGDKVIIDVGTGTIRCNFIYDLKQREVVDSIDGILDDSKILDDKLYYMTWMDAEKVKALKLPACDNVGLENSGYFEEYYYDFKTRKIISTGKYKCLK